MINFSKNVESFLGEAAPSAPNKIKGLLNTKMQIFNTQAQSNPDYQRVLELIKEIASTIKPNDRIQLTGIQKIEGAARAIKGLADAI